MRIAAGRADLVPAQPACARIPRTLVAVVDHAAVLIAVLGRHGAGLAGSVGVFDSRREDREDEKRQSEARAQHMFGRCHAPECCVLFDAVPAAFFTVIL